MNARKLLSLGKNPPVKPSANPIGAFQGQINKLFSNLLSDLPPLGWFGNTITSCPEIDITETDKEFKIIAEFPGMEAGDMQISTSEGSIIIKCDKKRESEEECEGYYHQARSYSSFQRIVALPEIANLLEADVSFVNGVLTLSVPKSAGAKERKIDMKEAA